MYRFSFKADTSIFLKAFSESFIIDWPQSVNNKTTMLSEDA